MWAVGIERGESRGTAAELQYPQHVKEAEDRRLGP
jgi:hypothetical protein